MRMAALQMNSTPEVGRNVEVAERLVRRAAGAGAELCALPEKWSALGPPEALEAAAEPLDGPILTAASSWARELGIWLLAGSIVERSEAEETLHNTSVLIDPGGAIVGAYRKVHMFDVDVGGVRYRESELETPGTEVVLADAGPVRLGMTVCFDLRFPELYRILTLHGAGVIACPSAFTMETGRDHWEVLLRARAVENQVFMIAPGQIGEAPPHYRSYGRSMIVDPWGTVLACAPDESEATALCDLDLDRLERVRERMPMLANRRPAVYEWPDRVAV